MSENEFYFDGQNLPQLHPDYAINQEVLVGALAANLDTARKTLALVLDLKLSEPQNTSIRKQVLWALEETHPDNISADS